MRLMPLISAGLVLAMSGSAFAQEDYTEFASKEERFTVTFPGKPTITETTWTSEYGAVLPARVYSVTGISGRHTLTVVDYRPIERILLEKAKTCPPGAETCQGVVIRALDTGKMTCAARSPMPSRRCWSIETSR